MPQAVIMIDQQAVVIVMELVVTKVVLATFILVNPKRKNVRKGADEKTPSYMLGALFNRSRRRR